MPEIVDGLVIVSDIGQSCSAAPKVMVGNQSNDRDEGWKDLRRLDVDGHFIIDLGGWAHVRVIGAGLAQAVTICSQTLPWIWGSLLLNGTPVLRKILLESTDLIVFSFSVSRNASLSWIDKMFRDGYCERRKGLDSSVGDHGSRSFPAWM